MAVKALQGLLYHRVSNRNTNTGIQVKTTFQSILSIDSVNFGDPLYWIENPSDENAGLHIVRWYLSVSCLN